MAGRCTDEVEAPEVAVLVPFLDEEENLPALIEALRAVLDRIDRRFEVILIDDGSRDASVAVAGAAIGGDPRFRVLSLQANYGKSAAVAAGRDHSTADILITMDADLQDPPEAIPAFLERIDSGDDLVAGWRVLRKERFHRRTFSSVFNVLVKLTSGIAIHDMNCGLKAYRRQVLESIYLSKGMHRFTALMAFAHGFRVSEVRVEHQRRQAGVSKYGVWRYFETAVGLLTALYVRHPQRSPMSSMAIAGAMLMLLSMVAAVCLGLLAEPSAVHWIIIAVCGLLSSQLILCGLVGELILQRLAHAQLHPPYGLVREQAKRR